MQFFIETEIEVHGEECCKLAWLGARRLLARCGCRNFDRLAELEQVGTFACGNAHRKLEAKEMSVTELELKTLNRTEPRAVRIELALSRNLEKERALKREKHLDKIKESAEMERAPKKTQSMHFNWKSIAKDEKPESVLTKYFRDLYSISAEQEELTQSERIGWSCGKT